MATVRSDLVAHIDLDALRHNYRALRQSLGPKVRLCAALKADAYGHGIQLVAPVLEAEGCDYAAVATVPEAVELRQIGWKPPILLLGNVLAIADAEERQNRLDEIVRHGLAVTVAEATSIDHLCRMGAVFRPIDIHLKIDSGMGRMGILPAEAEKLVRRILATPEVRLAGIYSHFASADLGRPDLASHQLSVYSETLDQLAGLLPPGVVRHLANSAATICLPDTHFDMVRPGLALYGYHPAPQVFPFDLQPALRLVSHITLIKDLPLGHCVGYGQTFTTTRQTKLGIVPVGYFDGFLRGHSNQGFVGVAGDFAPIIGRVSMDQLAIDLTELPPVSLGAEVVLISDQPDTPNSVAAIADRLGTIPYEVTCLLGRRIDRIASKADFRSYQPTTAKISARRNCPAPVPIHN